MQIYDKIMAMLRNVFLYLNTKVSQGLAGSEF